MKSLIFIISLLVSTETQLILCGTATDDTTNDKVSKDQSDASPTDGARQKQIDPTASADDLRKVARDDYNHAIENAKFTLDTVRTMAETRKEEAAKKRDEALKEYYDRYKKDVSVAAAIERRASRKLAEAINSAEDKYNETKSAANEKLDQEVEQHKAAYEVADDEFDKVREEIEKNRLKVAYEHLEALKKAYDQIETAVLVPAEERRKKAEENYRQAMRSGRNMLPEEKEKLQDELREEMDVCDEAEEKADDDWRNVLDTVGIGREYEAALDRAVDELEQARKKADLILEEETNKYENISKEAATKKREAKRLATIENSKAQTEWKRIFEIAEKQYTMKSKKAWRQWRKIQRPANSELKRAKIEFVKAQNDATNELQRALQMADEMERKSAKEAKNQNMTPGKAFLQENQGRPRRQVPTMKPEKKRSVPFHRQI